MFIQSTATTTAAAETEEPITSNPFWPAIDPDNAREVMRLDGTITAARLRSALVEAVAKINSELLVWRTGRQAEGRAALVDVPAEQVDGESEHVARYRRAVYCTAAANLYERYRSYDSSHEGHKRAETLADPIDDLRRDAFWAVRDIIGAGRNTIELI